MLTIYDPIAYKHLRLIYDQATNAPLPKNVSIREWLDAVEYLKWMIKA